MHRTNQFSQPIQETILSNALRYPALDIRYAGLEPVKNCTSATRAALVQTNAEIAAKALGMNIGR